MTDAPFMMEYTTAYKALEQFKTGIHALYLMNMEFFQRHYLMIF
jgi:hypothetical protein